MVYYIALLIFNCRTPTENINLFFFFFYIDKIPRSLDTNSIKSGLATRSPDELGVHQLRRNLFKLGKNQDQALKGNIY